MVKSSVIGRVKESRPNGSSAARRSSAKDCSIKSRLQPIYKGLQQPFGMHV